MDKQDSLKDRAKAKVLEFYRKNFNLGSFVNDPEGYIEAFNKAIINLIKQEINESVKQGMEFAKNAVQNGSKAEDKLTTSSEIEIS